MSRGMPQPSIVMIPTQGESAVSTHPRRPPANRSVSLLHSPRMRQQRVQQRSKETDSSSSNDSNQAQMRTTLAQRQSSDSPSSINPLTGKHSSGESSNAEKWFEKSNNAVRGNANAFPDNDPPYFLRNSSSSEEQADGRQSGQYYLAADHSGSLPVRTDLLHLGTDASSTEDFRSVIDDLTIENKKLKRRLKKYEKLHDSHLKNEKLFEVRIHGLPAEKKRELEETLRKFAIDLHNPKSGAEFPVNGYVGLGALLQTHKTTSSLTSLQNTDSAYASMSASGQGSAASDTRNRPFAQSAKSRHANIHTYLHHIPEGLLPNPNPATMTERAKRKLVTRRLEQIFAGKGAAAGGHQQALQQQDVSHMAARADRRAREAEGQMASREGVREANMLRKTAEDIATKAKIEEAALEAEATASTKNASVEQRPTRPLDIDLHRAQIPADNLQYMRHLGFTLPDDGRSPIDDQGWVYLNLLINMAQLHTLNVTSDFVRKAVTEHSAKLELSEDGRKLRWKGGSSVTRSSSTGGDSVLHRTDDDNSSQSPRKRVKLSRMDSDRDSNLAAQRRGMASAARSAQESNRFAYTPLFFHKDSTGDEDSSSDMDEDDAMSSPFPQMLAGDSSGMTSSGIRTTSTKNKQKHDDGPIIFYNNARFCTDLSGDRKPGSVQAGPLYKAVSVSPIGKPAPRAREKFFEKRGPLADATDLPQPMDLADNPIPESQEIAFTLSATSVSPVESPTSKSVDFEVTGIGGVYPADNFCIAVQSKTELNADKVQRSTVVPPRLARVLATHHRADAAVSGKQTIIARRQDLEPSTLPPALSYMQSDSMSDDGSDAEDNVSVSPDSPGAMPRLAAPQQLELPYTMEDSDGEMEYDEDDEDNDSDDGSLDLLAAAREIDPVAVRAREREYDANMAERLAEEIPAGSSAATAGGGSGFASPASGISRAAYGKNRIGARRSGVMPRLRASESMLTNGQESSVDSEEVEQMSVRS